MPGLRFTKQSPGHLPVSCQIFGQRATCGSKHSSVYLASNASQPAKPTAHQTWQQQPRGRGGRLQHHGAQHCPRAKARGISTIRRQGHLCGIGRICQQGGEPSRHMMASGYSCTLQTGTNSLRCRVRKLLSQAPKGIGQQLQAAVGGQTTPQLKLHFLLQSGMRLMRKKPRRIGL